MRLLLLFFKTIFFDLLIGFVSFLFFSFLNEEGVIPLYYEETHNELTRKGHLPT